MAVKKFAKTILKLMRWELIGSFPDNKKALIIAAPHTSIQDFIMGWLGLHSFGIRAKFIIKKEFFFFPVGLIIRALGAVPVKRGDRNNYMVAQMVEQYKKRNSFFLVITPEGTRKKVKRWKKGFHQIAVQAGVPIVISTVDYRKKQLGVLSTFNPTGDFDDDVKKIKEHYIGVGAKYPECFTLEN
ncbi:MAG: glycerol acyltransferase [Bacteroidetes bacterium]|nr:glycerol acyltransferase [Bacteroidota bacterium]PIX32535.1 MAG: glycerol acyltransferase [Bacteroidetes bacterium CG_4_8_14_3_um_filter_31_14]